MATRQQGAGTGGEKMHSDMQGSDLERRLETQGTSASEQDEPEDLRIYHRAQRWWREHSDVKWGLRCAIYTGTIAAISHYAEPLVKTAQAALGDGSWHEAAEAFAKTPVWNLPHTIVGRAALSYFVAGLYVRLMDRELIAKAQSKSAAIFAGVVTANFAWCGNEYWMFKALGAQNPAALAMLDFALGIPIQAAASLDLYTQHEQERAPKMTIDLLRDGGA